MKRQNIDRANEIEAELQHIEYLFDQLKDAKVMPETINAFKSFQAKYIELLKELETL